MSIVEEAIASCALEGITLTPHDVAVLRVMVLCNLSEADAERIVRAIEREKE